MYDDKDSGDDNSIGFPRSISNFHSDQFNVSSNQFRAKCDHGKESEFKFVFGHSKSTTQRSNYNCAVQFDPTINGIHQS